MIVSSGITSTGLVVSDYEELDVYGTANSTTVVNGGGLYISGGGIANGTTVSDGALYVSSGDGPAAASGLACKTMRSR